MQFRIVTTVVTAAGTYDLTTLAVIKDELSITNNASDATLKRYLGWASAALSQECNRVFAAETVQDQIWPARNARSLTSDVEVLQLARWPIIDIVSLIEDGVTLDADTDFVVDGAGHLLRIDSGSGLMRRWNVLPKVVQYDAGYKVIPGDLQDAVTRMVRNRYRAKGRDGSLMSETIPGVRDARWWIATGNEAGNIPPDVADLISSYRVPVIA